MGGTGGRDPGAPVSLAWSQGLGSRVPAHCLWPGADWRGHGAEQGRAASSEGNKGRRGGDGQSLPSHVLKLPSKPQGCSI